MREFWSGTWAAMESRQIRSDAGKEAVWYRRTIEAPKTLNGYDLTGVEVSFRFLANANGPIPEILYFNGCGELRWVTISSRYSSSAMQNQGTRSWSR